MAPRAQHVEQARRNRAHAEWLLNNASDDPSAVQWAVTAAFYCAVHCIEAVAADAGVDNLRHVDRDEWMRQNPSRVPGNVYFAYRELKNWSEQARYTPRDFQADFVRKTVLEVRPESRLTVGRGHGR